jgi:diamine N-acetyltransferase
MIRKVQEQDVSGLPAVGIEVFLNTYLRDGVSPLFADYVLSEFTAQKFRNAIDDSNMAIWVSETEIGIDGFVTVCSTTTPPLAECSPLETEQSTSIFGMASTRSALHIFGLPIRLTKMTL